MTFYLLSFTLLSVFTWGSIVIVVKKVMGEILPLAFTMMVGPQIITSIILVTARDVLRPSLAYIAGVALASFIGTLVFAVLARIFGLTGGSDEPSTFSLILQTLLILLLIGASIKTIINRDKITLPKWMSNLQHARPKDTFKTALLLIFLMPSDIAIMATVGLNLANKNASHIALLPFVGLTALIAATPLLFYLIFHKKALEVMPKVREWMNTHSWVVSLAAYIIFIFLLWS